MRLSMKRQILLSPFTSLSFLRYSLNFRMFTDCGNNMKSSYPFSFEMPESSAIAGSLVCDLSMFKFCEGRQYSVFGRADFVNIVSSMYMILYPSFLNFSNYLSSFCFSLLISSSDLLFCFFFQVIFLFLILWTL